MFNRLRLSPVLGFLLAGVVLGPHGFKLVRDVEDIAHIADIGVLFLLFEMGLELSLDRLKKLRVYAFGLGTVQVGNVEDANKNLKLCTKIYFPFPQRSVTV